MTRSAVAGSAGYVDRDDERGRESVLAPAEAEKGGLEDYERKE